MCTPQCICEKLGGLGFEEEIKAWKYIRHYTENLQKLQVKLRDLDDCTATITREVSEAIGRDDVIEVSVSHWQMDADSLKVDIEQLIGESTTKASISCIACSCPNIVWRYKFSKQAEEKIADANALIGKYNNFNHQISHPRSHYTENLQKLNYVRHYTKNLRKLTDKFNNFNQISHPRSHYMENPQKLKYVRHYTKNLQKLQVKLRDLDDCTATITREVSEAIGRDDVIEVSVSHWQMDADSLKVDIEQLIGESTTKASISCIACSCPNIVWRYKFSKQAEEKIADTDALIGKYNNFNHQISHPRSHYMEKLKDKLRDLGDCREIIRRKVSEDNGHGDEIEVNVLHWQLDADSLLDDIEQLIRESTNICSTECPCPDIMWQYEFSKQAEEKIADADGLIIKYNNFNQLESLSDKNYVCFDSRASIFKDIMDALKDSNVNMIGVFGLGGIGKTTLVKELGEQMRKDETFKQVAMAVVSKDLNVKEVQSRLADSLNFKFKAKADDQERRATELWNKLANGDKYLIILDDIWEQVKMEAIGIPCTNEKKGCKVVLTSRNEDLLSTVMEVDRNFSMAILSSAEAWTLFMKKVGNSIQSQPKIKSLAYEVCKRCKGLPIAINALSEALKGKQEHAWKIALDKLDKCMLTKIEGINPSVLASLRVSFDMLPSPDAKSCFLLCCLFAKDAEIPIDELMRLCVARNLLDQNPHTLDEATNAVRTVVNTLKSASLLTTGGHETVVKIHEVIRDVGISIAREEEAFLVYHGALRWPPNPTNGPSYKTMSLSFKNIKRLPDGLVYQQLETLMVDNSELSDLEVPDNFFNGMMQLTVLTFTRMRMRRLPSSLAKLRNLRMLYLNRCELENIAILKDLKSNLEVLSLRGSRIEALPPQIGQLTGLRLLDLQDCYQLKVIPRGVISDLTSLEELYFPKNFDKWEATADEQQDTSSRGNVSLEKLRGLLRTGQLTTLHVYIPDVMLLPKEDLIFANLKGFKISVGSEIKTSEEISGRCKLKLEGIQLRNEFIPLMDKAEVVVLSKIEGLKKVFHDRGVGNRFLDLKYLKVTSCVEDLEYLLGEPKTSVQSHGLHRLWPFNNLTVLIIEYCKSKYLFSPTTAKGLVHLEELKVGCCEIMEGIVGFEEQNDEDEFTSEVKFSKLKQLELRDLPNLLSFFAQKEKIGTTMGSSSARARPLFSENVILPILEILEVDRLGNIVEIWDKQSPWLNEHTVSFGKLRDVKVQRCEKLMNLVPSNILPRLQNLQKLCVEGCPKIESLVYKNEEAAYDSSLVIPQLWHLRISDMEKLTSFFSSTTASNAQCLFNHQVILPVLEVFEVDRLGNIVEIWDNGNTVSCGNLRDFKVQRCKKLMNLIPFNIPWVENLQKLCVEGCPKIESLVYNNEEAAYDSTLIIPQLRYLRISDMEKLTSFYSRTTASNAQCLFNHQFAFPKLENLELEGCASLRYTFHPYMGVVNLREIIIKHCSEMRAVISKEIDKDEEVEDRQQRKTETMFPNLSKLELHHLQELKLFCHYTRPLEFPLLRQMAICYCPSMDSFSLGHVRALDLSLKDITHKMGKMVKDGDDTTMTAQKNQEDVEPKNGGKKILEVSP